MRTGFGISGYLASTISLDLNVWFSDIMVEFNYEINSIVRLANDYLDVTADEKRTLEEIPQIKAINFFTSRSQFKIYLLFRYVIHKIRYYAYLIRFKYLKADI